MNNALLISREIPDLTKLGLEAEKKKENENGANAFAHVISSLNGEKGMKIKQKISNFLFSSCCVAAVLHGGR